MNPILLKTLIQLAASNKKPAPNGTVGSDAQLKNRIVLFADEAVALPDWGISGLPSMILGAAPQTCLFVSDLDVSDDDSESTDDTSESDEKSGGSVSFSLTIKAPPTPESSLKARTIVWKLSMPVAGFRDVQTGASTPPVHAPVIKTRIKLGGVIRDVEIGLLEMGPLDQPLLIGKDTLSNKFLIRPDRPEDQKAPTAPTVDLTPTGAEATKPDNSNAGAGKDKDTGTTPAATDDKAPDATAKPDTTPAPDTPNTPQPDEQPKPDTGADKEASDTTNPAPDQQQSSDGTQPPDAPQTTVPQAPQATAPDNAGKTDDADTAQAGTSSDDNDKPENTAEADPNDSAGKSEEDTTPTTPATPATPTAPEPAATNADAPKTQSAEQENNSA